MKNKIKSLINQERKNFIKDKKIKSKKIDMEKEMKRKLKKFIKSKKGKKEK